MLTLLIPGPKQPGNDIDVYLEPLVEDLNELQNNGVNVYDAFSKSMFNLKAMLMWTINDFPAYENLSGYSTKGKVACPVCHVEICSKYLNYSKMLMYMGHRQFLAPNHRYRKKASWFDGNEENRRKSKIVIGEEAFLEVKDFVNDKGKNGKKRNKRNTIQLWKKCYPNINLRGGVIQVEANFFDLNAELKTIFNQQKQI